MKFQNMFLAAAAAALVLSGPAMAGPKKGPRGPVATSTPSVSIVAPFAGATVHGTVPVEVAVSANAGATTVVLLLDGYFVDAKSFAPWSMVVATSHLPQGTHTLQAQVQDASGNWVNSAPVPVNVVAPLPTDDVVWPTKCQIVTPFNNSLVKGVVPVMVDSYDNVGIARVEIYLDNNPPVVCTGPVAGLEWDTTGFAPGSWHYVRAIASDAAGNYKSAPMVAIKIAP